MQIARINKPLVCSRKKAVVLNPHTNLPSYKVFFGEDRFDSASTIKTDVNNKHTLSALTCQNFGVL